MILDMKDTGRTSDDERTAMMQINPHPTQRITALRNRRYRLFGLAALLAAGLATSVALNWHDRLYFYLASQMDTSGDNAANRWLLD